MTDTTGEQQGDLSRPLTVHHEHSIEALWDEWTQLESRCELRLPFAKPWWSRNWREHFAQHRTMIKDNFWWLAVRDRKNQLRAVVPMVLTQRPGSGPFCLRILQMVGADPNVTEISGPICAPEDHVEVVQTLLAYLHERRSEWDILSVSGINTDAITTLKDLIAPARCIRAKPDYWLLLPGDWDSFRAGLGRNIKESLRKCYNSLKRDGHAFEFRVLRQTDEIIAALPEFFRLHAARAALSDTIEHRDVFSHPRAKAFLRACLQDAAALGNACVFQMWVGDTLVATRLGFRHDDQLYLYFSGYDPAWRQYSVMTTLLAETLKWAIASNFRLVNLSPGKDVSKLRWHPQETLFHETQFLSPTWRGNFFGATYLSLARSTRAITKWLPFIGRY